MKFAYPLGQGCRLHAEACGAASDTHGSFVAEVNPGLGVAKSCAQNWRSSSLLRITRWKAAADTDNSDED